MTVEIPTETGITLRLTKDDLDDDTYAVPPASGDVEYVEGFVLAESTVSDEEEPLVVEREVVPVVLTHDGRFVE